MTTPAWIDDYNALVEGRAAAWLDGWSSLTATGEDAGTLLNNFCTNDIPKLAVGVACEAFFPNAKGKVLAYGWVWRTAESAFRVVLGSNRASTLIAHLDRYVIREDVTLTPTEEPLTLTLGAKTPDDESVALTAMGDTARLSIAPSATTIAAEAWHAYRLERAVPLDGADVDERNLPQEVSRDATAISFTKGCYLGQETVARLDALGHVNQQLVQLQLDGEAEPGESLTADDKEIGRLTSVGWSPKHASPIALGYVRRALASSGSQVAGRSCQAVVL